MHSCCAPCSSYVIDYLSKYFSLTILYYNPNITDKDEYEKRLEEINNELDGLKESFDDDLEEKLDNIEEYYNKFINSGDIRKKAYELRNIVYLFEAYKHYANNDLDKVSDSINQVDVDRISIPCSKKSISILKEAIANNKKETVEEEIKEIENNEEIIDVE